MHRSVSVRRNGGSRRDFLRYVGASFALGTTCGPRLLAGAAPQTPSVPPLGTLLATTYTTGTVEERLDRAKAGGFTCVQMAMDCAGLPAMPDAIPADLPGRIRRAAATRGVEIASVTGTFNMYA